MVDNQVIERIDEAIQDWRQGDCVIGDDCWFLYRTDINNPLTEAGKEAASEKIDAAEFSVSGFMVVTQTCDIVRSCAERPFIEVCPLVKVEDRALKNIKKCRLPRYASVPGIEGKHIVADLDQVMTVEKSVVAGWERIPGCNTDEEVRLLSYVLARKRKRPAFPDDFTPLVSKLRSRLIGKHNKKSPEGEALRALREIRVSATPSWDYKEVEIFFLFIRDEGKTDFKGKEWYYYLEQWLKLIKREGRFTSVEGKISTLEDLTAKDYVESDQLDLNFLTESNSAS